MSEIFKSYKMASELMEAEQDSSEGDRIDAALKGIFEMLASIAFQLETLNANQTKTDSE